MQTFFCSLFENIVNQYIKLDPEFQTNLSYLQDKVIHIQVLEPELDCYLFATNKGFQLQHQYLGHTDSKISASLLNYLFLFFSNEAEKNEALFKQKVTISGDIKLGQQLQNFFNNLDIDWEEQLSQYTGDIIAHNSQQLLTKLINFGQHSSQHLQENMSDFLQYETRDLLERREMAEFLTAVDACRNDVDRLQARYQRILQNKIDIENIPVKDKPIIPEDKK